jgi:cytochrome b561
MYSFSLRLLHKILAIFIIIQLLIGFGFEWGFFESKQVITLHKSFGLCIFFITIFTIIAKIISDKPPYSPALPLWQYIVAKATHLGLYVCIMSMCLSGLIGSMLMDFSWKIFFVIPFPNILPIDQSLGWKIFSYHSVFATILGLLVILHILAALYHHFILKDKILSRIK